MSTEKKQTWKIDPRVKDIIVNTSIQMLAYLVGHLLKELIEKIHF